VRAGLELLAAILLYPGLLFTIGLGFLADRFARARAPRAAPARARRALPTLELRVELVLAVIVLGLADALLPLPGSLASARYANLGAVVALVLLGLWLRGLPAPGAGAAALAWALALSAVAVTSGTLEMTALRNAARPAIAALHLAAGALALACTALLLAAEPVSRARRRTFDMTGLIDQVHAGADWAAWGALALVFASVFVPSVRPRTAGLGLAVAAFVLMGLMAAGARRIPPAARERMARAILLPIAASLVLPAPGGPLIRCGPRRRRGDGSPPGPIPRRPQGCEPSPLDIISRFAAAPSSRECPDNRRLNGSCSRRSTTSLHCSSSSWAGRSSGPS